MTFILVWIVITTSGATNPPGVATGSAEFNSQKTCEEAKEALLASGENSFWRNTTVKIKANCSAK